jgi:hypothetical protein
VVLACTSDLLRAFTISMSHQRSMRPWALNTGGSGRVAGVRPYCQTLVLPDGVSNIADRMASSAD